MNPKTIRFVFFAVVLALGLVMSDPLRAQVAGAILSGTITDAQGAAVPNAKVSVRAVATGVTSESTSNSDGAYNVLNLIPGDYEVSGSAAGFSTSLAKVTLTVGAKQKLDLSLAVGQVTQTVEVTGVAPEVELESSTISGNIQGTEVRELPLNGRDWASLATLEPGVASIRTHGHTFDVRGFGIDMTISGARPTQNVYRLDGGIVNDYSNAGPGSVLGQNLGVDAIQEFSVLTSNYSAEYGFTSGGVINAVTKSGTNTFHGTAFDFLRNDKFDATNFFTNAANLPKPALRQNQFGGSAGWRVLKDKLFFFGDYEGVRQVLGTPALQFTLSNAVHAGNVTNLSTGVVSAVPIDPYIQMYLGFFPAPNGPALNANVGQFNWTSAQRTHEDFFTFRADQKISDKDSLFETYVRDYSSLIVPTALDVARSRADSYRQLIVLEETHVFTPSLTNTERVAFDRTSGLGTGYDFPGFDQAINPLGNNPALYMVPSAGSNSPYAPPGVSLLSTSVTSPGMPRGGGENLWNHIFQVYDDAFLTRGNHGLKFGFEFLAIQNDMFYPQGINGSGVFTSSLASPIAVADCSKTGGGIDNSCGALVNFLTDQARQSTRITDITVNQKRYYRSKVFGGYVQDDWRIRPSLTLNLGLRYEMSTNVTEKFNRVSYLKTYFSPTSDLVHYFLARNPTLLNFEPRIGFAWDPFHNGKTAVRGGFGIFDVLPTPNIVQLYGTSIQPYAGNFGTVGPPAGPPPPQGSFPYGIPALSVNLPLTACGSGGNCAYGYLDSNIKRNYVYQYNFNIQRQIAPTMTLVVGYAGSRGIHNPFLNETNSVPPVNLGNPIPGVGYYWPIPWTLGPGGAGAAAQFNPNVGIVRSIMWQSTSGYNGLQVKIDKRVSHGVQVTGSFTWSKSLDDTSGSAAGDTFANEWASPPWWDTRLDKGLSAFNIGRNLVINALWNAPTPHFNAVASRVLGGWQLGIITSVSDGVPFMPVTGMEQPDMLGEVHASVNPANWNGSCASYAAAVNPRNPNDYVKASCFSLVPQTAANTPYCDTARAASLGFPGTCPNIRGNLGRDTFIGPGLVNVDFSMIKNNYIRRISEAFNVQFRAEFFNLLNRANFALPPASSTGTGGLEVLTDVGQPNQTFSRITSTQTPNRQIQFALKAIW